MYTLNKYTCVILPNTVQYNIQYLGFLEQHLTHVTDKKKLHIFMPWFASIKKLPISVVVKFLFAL